MSAGNQIVNVRFEEGIIDRIREEVQLHNERSADSQWSVSDWMRKAVLEKIAHADRSRKRSGEKRYQCYQCKHQFAVTKIAYVVKPLYGKREYTCEFCSRVGIVDTTRVAGRPHGRPS
jgi:hypothetical protein